MINIVGKHIMEGREQQGITQEQLAIRLEMAGWQVDRFVVPRIERGKGKCWAPKFSKLPRH